MSFTNDQKAILAALIQLWSAERFVLIGAEALAQQTSMNWRQTNDLDLVVAVELGGYPAGLDKLPGWRQDPKTEQRWWLSNSKIDLIPAGPSLLKQGSLTWPKSGNRMNLTGLELAFRHWIPVEIDQLTVRVATIPVVALLKMAAFLDRPFERERDLEDLAHVLADYLYESDRRYEDPIFDLNLDFDLTTAYLLGQDVAAILETHHRKLVDDFFAAVHPIHQPATYYRMSHLGPNPDDPELLEQRFEAFRNGMTPQP